MSAVSASVLNALMQIRKPESSIVAQPKPSQQDYEARQAQEQQLKTYKLASRPQSEMLFQEIYGQGELAQKYDLLVSPATGTWKVIEKGAYPQAPALTSEDITGMKASWIGWPHSGAAYSMYPVFELTALVGVSIVAPQLIPAGLLSGGISGGVKYALTGKVLTGAELTSAMLMGEVFYGVEKGVIAGVGVVSPRLANVGGQLVSKIGKLSDYLPSPVPEIKETLGNVASGVSSRFRASAPQSLLNLVYGKQMGEAIGVERAFDWATPSVGGTAGMLEEAFGMPFYRAETLGMSMPTAEWASVRAVERMVVPRAIEMGWGWESSVLGFTGGQITRTLLPTREAFETSETLKMQMPTRRVDEQWYRVTKGSPQTPMEVTLRKAIERGLPTQGKGGLSAVQELVFLRESVAVPSPYTFPASPTKGFAMDTRALSYVGSPQLLFERSSLSLLGIAGFASGLKSVSVQAQNVRQVQRLSMLQELSQTTLQMQSLKQLQSLQLKEPQIAVQKQMFSQPPSKGVSARMDLSFDSDFSKNLFPKTKRGKSPWDYKYIWEFPVKGPKEMLKAI